MEKEPTNRELLVAIHQVRTDVRGEVSHAIHGVRGELLEVIQGTRDDLLEVIQSTRGEILEAMQHFASDVDGQFHEVKQRLTNVEGKMTNVETRLTGVESRLTGVESSMVTKAYLDDKLADEGSRYGLLIRETNDKTHRLVDALVVEGSLSPHAAGDITLSKPFGRK